MPSTTTNLGLYKKNPSTDGNDTFDITTMLNDNWDRLDAQLGAQVADVAPTAVNLVNGLQVVDVPQTAPLENLRITGRTLVNLLGRDGNCEDLGRWSIFQSTHTLNTANIKYGNHSIKVTSTSANYTATCRNNISLPTGNKYLVLAEFNAGTAPYAAIEVTPAIGVSNGITTTTGFGLAYKKFISTGLVGINLYTIATAAGQFFYVDGVRLYALSDSEYSAIDGMTAAQIAAKYPYVDDVKHVNSPYVIKYGENLLPPFNEWTVNSTTMVVSPYVYNQPATIPSGAWLNVNIPVIPNKDYFLSFTTTGLMVAVFDATASTAISAYSTNERTFNTGNNSSICVFVNGYGSGTVSNPMLNLGSTAKPFKPRNDDMLAFPNVQLASSVDGKVNDTLFKREGKYFVEHRFKKNVLVDGTLIPSFFTDLTGFKTIQIQNGQIPNIGLSSYDKYNLVKYDGKIVPIVTTGETNAEEFWYDTAYSSGTLLIKIPDTESGWGETYTPSVPEIQAYFNGWVMYDISVGNPANKYNGTGTKGWCYRLITYSGAPTAGTMAGGTATLPTSPAPNTGAFSPYKLTYQLATPTFEEIQVDGSMSLHEGLNQIDLGQGVIVREKVVPDIVSGTSVELNQISLSPLMRRTNRILSAYRNGKLDPAWQISSNNITSYWNGGGAATISSVSNYDKAATYEVTYITLDLYLLTSPVQVLTGEIASNLKSVVGRMAIDQADNDARIRAIEILARQIYYVPQKTTTDMTLYVDGTNGSEGNNGSAGKPFKTIQRAVNSVPQVVNHWVTINVAAGNYAEDVTVNGFVGSGIVTLTANGVVNVNSLTAYRSTKVQFIGFIATTTLTTAIVAANGGHIDVINCSVLAMAPAIYGISITNQKASVTGCIVSNRSSGIVSANGDIFCSNNLGTGNTLHGLTTQAGGRIQYLGTTPSGTLGAIGNETINGGGVINPWGDNTFANRSATSAYQLTGQALIGGVTTKVICPNVNFDNQSEYTIGTGRFTAKKSGSYLVSLTVTFPAMSGFVSIALYKNGGQNVVLCNGGTTNTSNNVFTGATFIYLNANDYIEMYSFTSVGITLASGSIFNVSQIA